MKLRFVQDVDQAFIELWTENDAETRMLASLEPMDHKLEVSVTAARTGVYGSAPIKSMTLRLYPAKTPDPEPPS